MENIKAPAFRWFVQDFDHSVFKVLRWMPYDDQANLIAEEAYTINPTSKIYLPTRKSILNLKWMAEKPTNQSLVDKMTGERREVRRGTWFYHEEGNEWVPYSSLQAAKLEESYRSGTFQKVEVSAKPYRFVIQEISGEFRQYRLSEGANVKGRLVVRGFDNLSLHLKVNNQSFPTATIMN